MRFLHNILAKAGLIVDGVTQLNTIANATIDTDKFLVSDGGVIKYRTGAQLGSDIGAANLAASTLKHQVKLGESINKGQAVYVSSADGTNMIVSKASNASEATSSKTLGLIETSGVLNDQVNVITEGLLAGLDTSTAAAGDPVWLGTNGNIIFGLPNKPYAPAHLVFIGIVTRVQQSNGEIFVKVQNGFELKEIHDVQITTTPSDNTVLAYESATSLYKMKSIATLLGYTPANAARQLTINGTTYDLTADRTWSVGTVTSIATTGPITGGTITGSGTIGITQATTSSNGYLSSTDWNTFNNKQNALTLTTTGSSGASTLVGATLNIPTYSLSGLGGVPSSRQLTINGTAYDLSANRSWSVGTVTSVGVSVPTGLSVSNTPVTGSGTIAISFTAGYSIPTTASQTNWDTAYNNRITSLTTTGTSGAATLTSNTLNIPQYQAQGSYITSLTGEATASGPGSASVTLTNSAVIGKVLTGLNVTGGTVLATDSILTAFGKLQNQVNGLAGGVTYQGTWNASTNSPSLTSSVGTKGYYYVVSVAGSTNLNGITDWKLGDWVIFNGTAWEKVDNTDAVVSVNGFTGAVSLTTSNISEGTNLYYTDTRARAAISLTTTGSSGAATYVGGVINVPQYTLAGLGGEPAIAAGTTSQYWRGDKSWQTLNTTVVPEGTNLYYTDTRSRAALSFVAGSGAYNSSTGVITIPTNTNQLTNGAGFLTAESDTLSSVLTRGNTSSLGATFGTAANALYTGPGGFVRINTNTYNPVDGRNAQSTNILLANYGGDLGLDGTVDIDFVTVDSNSVVGAYPHARIGYTGAYNDGINSSPEYEARGYFRIATRGEGTGGVLADRLLIDYNGVLRLFNYTTNGFLKFSSSNGTVTVDTNTYLTGNQNITLSGDVTGSGATSISTTLANSGVTAGTYGGNNSIPSLVIDSKGRVTSASTVTPSGTWGISISGSAASLSSNTDYFAARATGAGSSIDTFTDNGWRILTYTGYSSQLWSVNSGGSTGTVQFELEYNTPVRGFKVRNKTDNSSWSSVGWVVMTTTNQGHISGTILHSGNYNSYSPTLTGGGASGTWGINVTGTAASETLATVTGRGATTSTPITVTASEGREVAVYMPSSYTTDDLVSGHEYGWYNDHWRLGMTRSGGAAGADFVVQWNGSRRLSLTNGGDATASGSMRAPIFYDSDNTAYYLDPNSTSILNGVRVNALLSPNGNTVVAADSALPNAASSFIHTLALGPGGNDGHILGMTWTSTSVYGAQIWVDTDPTNTMAFRSRSAAGVWTGWNTILHNSNYNSYSPTLTGGGASGTWGINITGTAGSVDFNNLTNKTGGTGTYQTSGDFRAPIFYDSANTAYYVDPAGISNLAGTFIGAVGIANYDVTAGTNATVKWTLRRTDGTVVSTTQSAYIYRVKIVTTGTGTDTGTLFLAQNIDGAGWSVRTVYRDGVGSNHPYLFVDSDGLPKVTIDHPANYTLRVIVEEINGGNSGATQGVFGSDAIIGYDGAGVTKVFTGSTFLFGSNTVLHSGNYNSYSPTLTGGGASGTWGIAITGNAGTATTLQNARTINGTSFNGSANIVTSYWGTSRTLTIGSTGKSVDGSANVSWSLAEIGAQASGTYLTPTNTDFTYNASLTLSTSWQDTGVNNSNLTTSGVYMVTCLADDFAVGGGHYNETYVGTMYWFSGSTNSVNYSEIALHHMGHADNDRYIYLRTRTTPSAGGSFLQMRSNVSNSGASTYIFKFKRLM